MIDSLSKCEPIHFKKDISGFIKFSLILYDHLFNINYEINSDKNDNCIIELKNFKSIIEKQIKYNNSRMEMLK